MRELPIRVFIICPCYNEAKYIEKFLQTTLQQTIFSDHKFHTQLIIIDGASSDGTTEILRRHAAAGSIMLLNNPARFVSQGLNTALKLALKQSIDYVIRMDIHAEYPLEYAHALVQEMDARRRNGEKLGNIGFAVETLPGDETEQAYFIAKALSSRLGVGTSSFRLGVDSPLYVDTLPFGVFPIEVFRQIGLFDEMLVRNQDDEFNARLCKHGYKLLLLSQLKTKYFARTTLTKVRTMFYQYGYYKPLVNFKLGRPASLRQFFPLVFVIAIIGTIAIAPVTIAPLIFLASAYASICVLFYREARPITSRNVSPITASKYFLLSCATLLTIHVSYGMGYLVGGFKLLLGRAHIGPTKASR